MRASRTVVDKYTTTASRWLALVARMLLPAGLFALSVFGAVPSTAHAQTIDSAAKLAPDLVSALNAPTPPKVDWLKVESTGRYVKVVIMAVSADPLLTDLRSVVVAAGGSVYYMYQSVQGVSAMLPGAQVLAIAARPDVDSISPNRPAAKAASSLEMTSGAANVRTTIFGVRTGYDGFGE
jgi:serine protease AprX